MFQHNTVASVESWNLSQNITSETTPVDAEASVKTPVVNNRKITIKKITSIIVNGTVSIFKTTSIKSMNNDAIDITRMMYAELQTIFDVDKDKQWNHKVQLNMIIQWISLDAHPNGL